MYFVYINERGGPFSIANPKSNLMSCFRITYKVHHLTMLITRISETIKYRDKDVGYGTKVADCE